jgi:TolB-like protein
MMRIFTPFITSLLLASSLLTAAQDNPEEKTTVAVLPFTASSIVKPEDVETIYGQVTEAFVNARRFTVIERKQHEAIFQELEKQKGEIYMSSTNLAKQGMQLGANFLVLGDVGAGGSNSSVTITLKLVDVETSEIIASKNISSDNSGTKRLLGTALTVGVLTSGASKGYYSNADVATNAAGQTVIQNLAVNSLDIGKRTKAFINDYFPLNAKILKIEAEKGGEAEKVLIGIGEGMDLRKGQSLYVYEQSVMEAGGKKFRRKTELGQVRIETIEGAVSLCKVSKGGETILKKFANKEVYVSTNKSK